MSRDLVAGRGRIGHSAGRVRVVRLLVDMAGDEVTGPVCCCLVRLGPRGAPHSEMLERGVETADLDARLEIGLALDVSGGPPF